MSITTTAPAAKEDHVLIFPFLAKGHTIPLLHLASSLSSRNIPVTLITTPANAPFFRGHLTSSKIHLLLLPFPFHPSLPSGVESTDSLPSFSLFPAFVEATASLHAPFLRLLRSLLRSPSPPLCLISDFFLGWTLPICRRFGLPRLVFHGMSTYSMSLIKSLWNVNIPKDEPFSVAGAPPDLRLTIDDLPESVIESVDTLSPSTQFLNSIGETDIGSWGVIVNSFAEIEPPAYVQLLGSFYGPVAGGRVWLIGPLNLLAGTEPVENPIPSSDSECIQWLDRQPDGSVLYVAFGTQAEVSDEQLDEVAHGLARAGVRFLWAIRSETWVQPEGLQGRIERGWVPQKDVLGHVAVGGFVSHCGWNSVLEAVSAGVAMLTWPMIAEQCLNAKMVAEEIGVGIRLTRTAELAEKAKAAVMKGGSSYETLEKLLEELRKVPTATAVVEVEEGEGEVEAEVKLVQREWNDGLLIA